MPAPTIVTSDPVAPLESLFNTGNAAIGAEILALQNLGTVNVADLDALPSASIGEGKIIHVDDMNCNFQSQDGAWVQINDSRFSSTGARDTAYAKASGAYLVAYVKTIDSSTGITYRWNGSAWKGWESDLIAYTATVGANITLGTGGTKNAWYQWVNGTPRMKAEIVLGTGGSVGASVGNNTITLPPVTIAPLRHAYQTFKGNVMFHDASVQTNFSGGLFSENTSTTVARIVYRSGPETNISATVPFGAAFTVGDCIEIDVWLEVA